MSRALQTLEPRRARRSADFSSSEDAPISADQLLQICSHNALEMVAEPIMFVSTTTSRVLQANRAACRMLGYSRSRLQNVRVGDIAFDATPQVLRTMSRRLANGQRQDARVRVVLRHRNGSALSMRCCVRVLRTHQDEVLLFVGAPTGRPLAGEDDKVRASTPDDLTRLPGREWLWSQLEAEVEAAHSGDYQFAVLFIDIDNFKQINDSCGHLVGDQVLQSVANRLLATVRPEDSVARFGGDEFVVLLKHIRGEDDIDGIVTRISRSMETVGRRRTDSERRLDVTVSIGVAICGAGLSPVEAIERADQAMYRAKALGRNGRFAIDDSLSGTFDGRELTRVADRERQSGELG